MKFLILTIVSLYLMGCQSSSKGSRHISNIKTQASDSYSRCYGVYTGEYFPMPIEVDYHYFPGKLRSFSTIEYVWRGEGSGNKFPFKYVISNFTNDKSSAESILGSFMSDKKISTLQKEFLKFKFLGCKDLNLSH